MSNEIKKDGEKYLYFRLDFTNCPTFDFDYTICVDLSEVSDYLSLVETDLDNDGEASVKITGIGLTNKEWREWQKKNVKP